MGHLGLMPQSINKYGTYTVRAKDDAEAEKLVRDAHLLEEAGCFGLVLEKIPAALAARVASELTIPVIGKKNPSIEEILATMGESEMN